MRWRFLDGSPDLILRERKLDDIDRWWSAFEDKLDELDSMFGGGPEFDVASWMSAELGRVHPDLMWEFGPAVGSGQHRLVVTPEHRYQLTELARTIVQRAPDLEEWEFYAHRLAESSERAESMVASRTKGSMKGVTVAVAPGQHRLIDLTFYSVSPTARHDALVATETLLGEEALNRWVGVISAERPKRKLLGRSVRAVPFDELSATFEERRRLLLAESSAAPWHERIEEAEWSLLRLQPREARDYPGTSDLAVATTADIELWTACHAESRFASERFSRLAEVFAYLKIDGVAGLEGSAFDDRSDIEDALNAVLVPAGLGCVVGGGTGLRYSYVDLCFTDVDQALAAARTSLRAGQVPERTWIQFYDRHWSAEWVGVYEHTPEPPHGDRPL